MPRLPRAFITLSLVVNPCAGDTVNTTASWLAKRSALVRDIFGTDALPKRSQPDTIRHYGAGLQGLVWDMSTIFDITSTIFYSPREIGKRRCNETHDPGYTWWDLYNVSDFFHDLGYDVFIFSMPLKGVNLGPGSNATHLNTDHWWFLPWERKGDTPLRYFMEPVVLTANYATQALGYEEINMAGLSGGGWSTTLASAIDPRIKRSFPIAGSVPCAMRNPLGPVPNQTWTGNDDEDYEQSCMPTDHPSGKARDDKPGRPIYTSCNYTCQYLLAGLEPGRFQLQILHEYDTCCFSPHGRHEQMLSYEANVRAELTAGERRAAGTHGWFTSAANAHRKHEVSAQDKTLIAAALKGSFPPGSPHWQTLECDLLHQVPPGGKCAPDVEPGLPPRTTRPPEGVPPRGLGLPPPTHAAGSPTTKAPSPAGTGQAGRNGSGGTPRVVTCAAGANCTHVLQTAIDGGGDVRVEGPFSVAPIFLRTSGQTVTFAPGSVVSALAGAFKDGGDCLFTIHAASDVTVIGYGATWRMQKDDYANASKYSKSEHRHGLQIISSIDTRVLGLTINQTGGDGVYVVYSLRTELRDIITDGAYRNGLSIIDAHTLLVAGCRFLRTGGTPPEAGVDIEPNHHKPGRRLQQLANITFVDLECRQNRGTGFSLSLGKLLPNVSAVDITVRDAIIEGLDGSAKELPYNIGLFLGSRKQVTSAAAKGSISITNMSVMQTAQPGFEVMGKLPDDFGVALRKCRFAHVGTASTIRWGGQNVPMLLHQSSPMLLGGFSFDEVEVDDDGKRPFLKCDSCDSRGNLTNVSGSMLVRNAHGCESSLGSSPHNVRLQIDCKPDSSVAPPPAATVETTSTTVAPATVTFATPKLVGRSADTKFWCPNEDGGFLDAGESGDVLLRVQIDGDGTPPTNCTQLQCPPIFYSMRRSGSAAATDASSSSSATADDAASWRPYPGPVMPPSHRYMITFPNGTRRGFDHEVLLASNSSTGQVGIVTYTDFAFDGAGRVTVLRRGAARLTLPPDVQLNIMYKTKNSLFRIQVGGVELADGTRLIVAEGTRRGPLGSPDSSFVFSTSDDGNSWALRHVFDRQDDMPTEPFRGRILLLGPSEPAIAMLPDGKTLVTIARLRSHTVLWQASSVDGGVTWTPMVETAAWAVYPQLLTLPNGVVLLASGRPSILLWLLDTATLKWTTVYNLANAHNAALPSTAPAEWRFDETYAHVRAPTEKVVHQLSKAYLGIGAVRCGEEEATDGGDADGGAPTSQRDGSARTASSSCRVLIAYDRLANGNDVPPGPSGKYDRVFTMEATVTASPARGES